MKKTLTLPAHQAKYPCFSDMVLAKGTYLFVSAQSGRDKNGTWPLDFARQLDTAICNLSRALAAGGATLEDVVQVTAYLSDARNGDADHTQGHVFNEVYARHFKSDWPARSRVQAALQDQRCLVEIDAFAVIDQEPNWR